MNAATRHFTKIAPGRCAAYSRSMNRRTIPGKGRQGSALLIVLAFLVLITVLILTFFNSVTTATINTKAGTGAISARQLADSAVQMVEGTITTATVPNTDTTFTWASQPGMIRTYGGAANASALWKPLNYYKLYSSGTMVVNNPNATSWTPDEDVQPLWDNMPGIYTDLNAPVQDSTGNNVFPIVDPRASYTTDQTVEGFSYSNQTPINSTGTVDGVVLESNANTSSDASNLRIPMPVQWIYVLKDGSLATPTVPTSAPTTTTNTASFTTGNIPTASNPIVGRIAFWTDDECAKVNLNTASEGTYWDTPVANSGSPTGVFTYPITASSALGDLPLIENLPGQYEYQRYPGHPATTCLSTVFGSSLSALTSRGPVVQAITTATPRVNDLDNPDTTGSTTNDSSLGGTQNATANVPRKYDRLYATVDDFNFLPNRTAQNVGTGGASTTQQIIQRSRFFLTTKSKGSDLNLFGLPRITIWPVWDDAHATSRSNLDYEMLRCSTVNNSQVSGTSYDSAGTGSEHRMQFDRDTALSPTIDFNLGRNQQLYNYLLNLTSRSVPGFGNSFSAKYSATDQAQILTEIFDYIRSTNLADQSAGVPTGNNICTTSYTPSVSPTATTLSVPVGEVVPTVNGTARGFGRIPTISELALVLDKVDDRISTTTAEGTSNQANTIAVTYPTPNAATGTTTVSVSPTGHTFVEWALIPKFFCPMAGFTGLGNNIRFEFTISGLAIGSGARAINEVPSTTNPYSVANLQNATPDMFFGQVPVGTSQALTLQAGQVISNARDSVIGGEIGIMTFNVASYGGVNEENDISTTGANKGSLFPTGLAEVTGSDLPTGGTIALSAFTVTVNAYSPASSASSVAGGAYSNLIQTLNFSFPAMTVPIPKTSYVNGSQSWNGTFRGGYTWSESGSGASSKVTFVYTNDQTNRNNTYRLSYDTYQTLESTDVIRSVTTGTGTTSTGGPATLNGNSLQGDMRLVAASATVPSTAFTLQCKSGGVAPASTDFAVDTLRFGTGEIGVLPGFVSGALFPLGTMTYATGSGSSSVISPSVPGGITAVYMQNPNDGNSTPGDWDNGMGMLNDGPYVNKPDEGETPPSGTVPYIGSYQTYGSASVVSSVFFSPNRQISSPVMFGSLPVGLDHPWRTLLFRPATLPGYQETSSTSYTHPGNNGATSTGYSTIPDHLLLDLFRMPVVEPYGISEPLATAGQVNLNTQIAPFTYISRTTGLRAVLKSVMITALNPAALGTNGTQFIQQYKGTYDPGSGFNDANNFNINDRYPIDLTNTTALMYPATADTNTNGQTAFPEFTRTTHTPAAPNFFVSASQICDLPLIPLQSTPITTLSGSSGLAGFWATNQMTGDNSLERPYSQIYPRVTTRSNTFMVHVRAQSLQVTKADMASWTSSQATWTEGTDLVTGEYRGSFTIEKYFDPNNATITASGGATTLTDANDGTLSSYTDPAVRGAKWRLLDSKRVGQ